MDTFVLSSELRLHEQDVKCVCALASGGIASGSRDRATVLWERAEDGEAPRFRATSTHSLHEHFVNSVCEYGAGQVASGSGSGNVGGLLLWDVAAGSEAVPAPGHTKNVCALATAPGGDLLSGSWDNTARVWRGGETVAVLAGHEGPVWAVIGLESGALVTGSGDKTIKLWQDGVCVKTLTAHTDAVRSLQCVPGIGFISASNDGTVKLWSADGAELATYACHDVYIYSVAVLSSSEFATCSEDKSLKVFKDGQPSQTIQHPGVVWSAAVLPDGDLVTGCQDGVVRVWTRNPEKVASAEEIAAYEEQLAAQTISSQEAGNVDPSKLPGPEALEVPGDSDGQVKLVKSANGGAEAHSWSAAEMRWVMVGTVVDGPGGAGGGPSGGMVGGVTYDFVFDVDLEDGSPMRKLGVNRGEDPMMAAYRFLENEEVPTSSTNVDQITEFIEQQVGAGFTLGADAGAGGGPIDPLTGTGAYVPSYGATGGGAVADDNPWMSGYRPPAADDPMQTDGGGGANPWLPEGRYVPGGEAAAAAPPVVAVTFPLTTKATYSKGNVGGIAKKVNQFAAELALGAEQTTAIGAILESLASADASDAGDGNMSLLEQLLVWPAEKVFPAIDLCKLLVLRPNMQAHSPALLSQVLEIAETMAVKLPNGTYATVEKVRYANTRLALEFITNCVAVGSANEAAASLVSEQAKTNKNNPMAHRPPSNRSGTLLMRAPLNCCLASVCGISSADAPDLGAVSRELLEGEQDREARSPRCDAQVRPSRS